MRQSGIFGPSYKESRREEKLKRFVCGGSKMPLCLIFGPPEVRGKFEVNLN